MASEHYPEPHVPDLLTLVGDVGDPSAPPPCNGFVAYLENASLHDLLQLESQAHSTGVFGVTSGGQHGYLHLRDGELIHAQTDQYEGEEAVFQILSWTEGRFQCCALPLSNRKTLGKPLELLLLMLSKRADEIAHSTRVPLPVVAATTAANDPTNVLRNDRKSSPSSRVRRKPTLPSTDVVVSSEGTLVDWRGENAVDFAGQAAYSTRLGDLIGKAIGSGRPSQIELYGTKTRTVIFRLPEGSLAASRCLHAPLGRS